jgi:hypothetical protein
MPTLTKEQITAVAELEVDTLHVPEWGGDVLLMELSSDQREELELRALKAKQAGEPILGLKGVKTLLAAWAIVDEKRKRMFVTPEEVESLGRKKPEGLERIVSHVMKRNRLREEDRKALSGNSPAVPAASSSST